MPAKKGTRFQRTAAAVNRHPWWSWATIVSVITVLGFVGPIALWAFGFMETKASGKEREDKLRAELTANVAAIYAEMNKKDAALKADIDKLRSDFEAHKANVIRNLAWNLVQSISMQQSAMRNRVNDCDIKKDKREMMTPLERIACQQYKDEFDDATSRLGKARESAMATTKEK